MSLPDFSLATGDRLPTFSQTFLDDEGNEFNLTGWTCVLNLQDKARANSVISISTVTVSNTPSGVPAVVTVSWGATDTLVGALYDAEFVATQTSTGKTMTWRRDIPLVVEFRVRV